MLTGVTGIIAADLKQTEMIINQVTGSDDKLTSVACRHILTAGGKRLRPMLVLLSARTNGSVSRSAHELAAAIELIHVASLVHDDIVDGASVRRGVDTLHTRWDERVSVLVGDYMLSRAFELIADYGCRRIIKRLADVLSGMATSELEQIQSDASKLTEKDYLYRIEKKTAALMAGCCEIGAIVSGAGRDYEREMYEFGRLLGLSFQITDDVLDVAGDEQDTGKAPGTDIAGGVLTLPVVRVLASEYGDKVRALLDVDEICNDRVEQILKLIRASDAIDYCRGKAKDYCERARDQLQTVSCDSTRQSLINLCDFVLNRQY